MELREIETFLMLAEELHFGRTAERLYLAQSRVSQTIRSIETSVGGRLFDRTSRQAHRCLSRIVLDPGLSACGRFGDNLERVEAQTAAYAGHVEND